MKKRIEEGKVCKDPNRLSSLTMQQGESSSSNSPNRVKTSKFLCQFEGRNLDKKDTFGKSDPYVIVWQLKDDEDEEEICRTPIIKKTLNPSWDPVLMTLRTMGRGNQHLKICCYDYDIDRDDELVGEFYTSLNEMMEARKSKVEWKLINPDKLQRKKDYKHSGILCLTSIEKVS